MWVRRKGWRGPITNIKNKSKWIKEVKKFKLEKSIGWNLAIIKKINESSVEIETDNKNKGFIEFKELEWIKKEPIKIFNKGDIVYVKKIKDNLFSLEQLPKANGGIIVMDPYTGRVLAMSGGFSFKKSECKNSDDACREY